jgi:hypothetical protein
MAILNQYMYLIQVSKNDDEKRCFLKKHGFNKHTAGKKVKK